MPRRSDARKRMIRSMSRLMQRQGYSGTGLNEVVKESGAPKGSMYFHFPGGKEQLAAEAIGASGDSLRRLIEMTLAAADGPEDAVRMLCFGLAAALESSGYTDGCPIATVALETSAKSDTIADASAGAFRSWEGAIAKRFTDFGWPEDEATSAATLVLAAVEGGLLLSRAYRDTAPLKTIGVSLGARLAKR